MINRFQHVFVLCILALSTGHALAETSITEQYEEAQRSAQAALHQALAVKQSVSRFTHKKNVTDKSAELAIYISLDAVSEQKPNAISIEINLNGNQLVQTDYSAKAINALLDGASHQIFVGHISKGSHDLIAHIKEYNSNQTIRSHGAIRFNKDKDNKVYELSISVSENDIPPEVVFIDHS